MAYRIQVATLPQRRDARGEAVAAKLAEWLRLSGPQVRTRDVFTVDARITAAEAALIAREIANPVLQQGLVGEQTAEAFDWLIVVGFLPGVTDNVARTLGAAIRDILGRELGEDEHVYSAIEYLLTADGLSHGQVRQAAVDLLANPLIQSVKVLSRQEVQAQGVPLNRPVVTGQERLRVEEFDLAQPLEALQRLSSQRTLSLSRAELLAIQQYYQTVGRDGTRRSLGLSEKPTDVELEAIAQTWSEHCKHKIFAADIEYVDSETGEKRLIHGCFDSFIKRSTEEIGEHLDWLRSVFKDNAGVIAFNDRYDLVYKVETHNSPSALDPYGGAMTGIVGVNRDPLGTGMGANLLVNVWGYCLASPFTPPADVPAGLLHPRRLRDGVHLGVIEGGNQSGIPYGLGWEYFDERYLGKPLVFCGTVGLLPRELRGQPGWQKEIRPGDKIVMAGGRIGKDGIHGATFSSEELHAESPVQAVQIGDPITQKRLYDFTLEARDLGLYRFLTDNGAGGLSSSLGEMARESNGCRLDLAEAPLKYAGLQPWEILLSEAQERMSYAVPAEKLAEFLALAARREVEACVLGEFTATGKFHVLYDRRTVAYLDLEFLHDGCPQMQLKARWQRPSFPVPAYPADADLGDLLTRLLARLNLCSGEFKARQYDHEVKGLSVVKPYVGVQNDVLGDATVFLAEPAGREGLVLAAGILPRYSDLDTYGMAAAVIDLAIRRAVAVGASPDRLAGLDNFCWPDPVESDKTPDGPYKLAQLVRANQALYDVTKAFGVPCISGKDSMKNDSTVGGRKISIPPTLLFSVLGRIDDVGRAVTIECKRAHDHVYILGLTRRELGGSEFHAMLDGVGGTLPSLAPAAALKLYHCLHQAITAGLCRSVHTPALGGLAAGFAKVAMGGRLGLRIDLDKIPAEPGLSPIELLFAESNSRFIVTVAPTDSAAFAALFAGLPCACVGKVKYEQALTFFTQGALEGEVNLEDLLDAYKGTLTF